jgi:hypothetical protein
MTIFELADKELTRIHELLTVHGEINQHQLTVLCNGVYDMVKVVMTAEGATQNSLAGEHGYNDEVAANREMIG